MPLMVAFLGPQEIILILVLLIIIFGASRLPQLGAGLGKGIRNFKKSVSEDDEDDKRLNENKD